MFDRQKKRRDSDDAGAVDSQFDFQSSNARFNKEDFLSAIAKAKGHKLKGTALAAPRNFFEVSSYTQRSKIKYVHVHSMNTLPDDSADEGDEGEGDEDAEDPELIALGLAMEQVRH